MSTRSWVPAALLTLTAGACGAPAEPIAPGQPPFRPVASIDQVMDSIIIPSSQAIFDSVVYSNGELVQAPRTDDDWQRLHMHALAVAEAGNLLMMTPRAKDAGDWIAMSGALNDRAMAVAQATERRDLEALLENGGHLYSACTACHEKYIPPD